MPQSTWKAKHGECQAAVDNVKRDLQAEITRLRAVLQTIADYDPGARPDDADLRIVQRMAREGLST